MLYTQSSHTALTAQNGISHCICNIFVIRTWDGTIYKEIRDSLYSTHKKLQAHKIHAYQKKSVMLYMQSSHTDLIALNGTCHCMSSQ